jgi:hypothetical protein
LNRTFRVDHLLPDGETPSKGADLFLTEADMALPADEIVERFFRPALKVLLQKIKGSS